MHGRVPGAARPAWQTGTESPRVLVRGAVVSPARCHSGLTIGCRGSTVLRTRSFIPVKNRLRIRKLPHAGFAAVQAETSTKASGRILAKS